MVRVGDRYTISEPIPIAETNDSILFLGVQNGLGREVVLKRKKSDNWYAEALRTSKLNHPNIVKIIEVIPEEKTIVLECIRGVPLSHLIYEEDFAGENERLECAIGIAAGLRAIHREGEAHKDLSTSNIIYDMENRCPKIIDFGVNSSDWCSPSTEAPEHDPEHPAEVGPYTDIYDFGIILQGLLPRKRKIIKKCMRDNPKDRIGIDQLYCELLEERSSRRSSFRMIATATVAFFGVVALILNMLNANTLPEEPESDNSHLELIDSLSEKPTDVNLRALRDLLDIKDYNNHRKYIKRNLVEAILENPTHQGLEILKQLGHEKYHSGSEVIGAISQVSEALGLVPTRYQQSRRKSNQKGTYKPNRYAYTNRYLSDDEAEFKVIE